ncbi:MAG TPA: SRPBCC family protein [Pseudonocardiaceae bacterium]|jgi:uncharacterized protein YndB with AHSA1/START domain|nr:SRPBCC family protein [Pseudonocardiaceae bacterium]
MTEHTVKHHTFTIERTYPATVARVFRAWSDPDVKGRWFAGAGNKYELDFRVGGIEVNRAVAPGGTVMVFESRYHDIVAGERIVYNSTLSGDGVVSTVSLTTVEFCAGGDATRLVLVEQGTFLDGQEQPGWREQGTSNWLDALGAELRAVGAS